MREKALRAIIISLVFLVSLILQTTILPLLQFHGVMPDLLLILIVLTGLFFGSVKGGAVGFAVGLLEDLLAGRYLGLGALSGFLAGYTVGYLEGKFYRENPLVPLFLVFLGSILFNGVFFAGREVTGAFSAAVPSVLRRLLLAALYNTFLAALLYRPLFRIIFPGGSSRNLQTYGEFYR
ncbi:MAG TPA: rod shape-determining protein MreD [Syntrophomonadaceae bacterium]|nr:rod shape-determining protein MreD [Syntrophomonadaceae bacterium]